MEPQSGGEWEREHRGLCQCLVSTDIDTYRLGKNCAEGAQTSRTPMSSCQDYASRRPQEPWKYLDIFFAPPLVCSATQCIIFCGRETRFQVARGRTLKGRACIFLKKNFLLCDCISATQQEQFATTSRHHRFFFINSPSVPCSLSLLER